MSDFRSEVRDGMRIDWDVPITVDDGLVLRADVYRPIRTDRCPVVMSHGPYGKWLRFEDLYTDQWRRMLEQHPDVPAGSTNRYQNWEVVDRPPEIFGKSVTLHCGPRRPAHVLLPIIAATQ